MKEKIHPGNHCYQSRKSECNQQAVIQSYSILMTLLESIQVTEHITNICTTNILYKIVCLDGIQKSV